jgi:hypothetical protein
MDETVQIYENVLRCPHCGGNNTHHFSVAYERNEDDPEKDIAISFRCEACLRISELTFAQHKGETLVKWRGPVWGNEVAAPNLAQEWKAARGISVSNQ